MDDLDLEQSVHEKSIEKTTHTFHGTWGYLHRVHPDVLASIDCKTPLHQRFHKLTLHKQPHYLV